jgi:hypothetical protein
MQTRRFAQFRYGRASTVSSGTLWIGRTVSQCLQLGQCQMNRCVL